MSSALYVIAEGYSENGFLNRLLGAHLGALGLALHVPIIGKATSKGGLKFRSFDQVCQEVVQFLRSRQAPYVTTFFDFYGLPTSHSSGWQFVADAKKRHVAPSSAAAELENHFLEHVTSMVNRADVAARFHPYVQVHELEALFFSQPDVLAETLGNKGIEKALRQIVTDCGGCELINDSPQTAPSKRLERVSANYKKGRSAMAHAPRLGSNLDLSLIRTACPRFHNWLSQLEFFAENIPKENI
jgi:hypothetical protein